MLGAEIPIEFAGVIVGGELAVDHAQGVIRVERVRFFIGAVDQRIEAAIPEQLVLQDAAARVRSVVDG